MSTASVGLLAGMALGFAAYFGNFWAFLLVAALGLVGLIVGRFLQGDLEISDFMRPREQHEPDIRSRERQTSDFRSRGRQTPDFRARSGGDHATAGRHLS